MGEDVRAKLRRLGVVKGARNLKSPPAPRPLPSAARPSYAEEAAQEWPAGDGEVRDLEVLLPGGKLVQNSHGACFVLDSVYPLTAPHGNGRLDDMSPASLATAATFCQDERLFTMRPDNFLFLDTETTGLGGAGTLAFMVGVALFEGDALLVRQFFLRDHADEAAMLHMLADLLAERPGLITFNGRSFDIPLLDNRYLMQRLDGSAGDLLQRPHIDLLPPSRRLWRRRLPSCSLGSLEQNILGLPRTGEDVPGWAIPGLYMSYLRDGDARDMLRVFYHNRMDILSMVVLTARIAHQFAHPVPEDDPLDLLGLARWQLALGMSAEAEDTLRLIAGQDAPLETYHQSLLELGLLLKRAGRREEALPLWQQVAVTSFEDVSAHVELAKHYEWQSGDLQSAKSWTRRALALLDNSQSFAATTVQGELEHRLARLERKLVSGASPSEVEEEKI
jgi:uncharacterized protein YprB with RNaseH-like and TPR domain/Flp pilus assembly protein TadD